MGIMFTLAAIFAAITIPCGIIQLAQGKGGMALLCFIALVFFGAICVSRFFKNKTEVNDLKEKFDDLKKKGYTAEEAKEANKELESMRNTYRFEFITFPMWELNKLKKLKKEGTSLAIAPPKVENDPRVKELEAEIVKLKEQQLRAAMNSETKPAEKPVEQAAKTTTKPAEEKAPAKEPEPKAEESVEPPVKPVEEKSSAKETEPKTEEKSSVKETEPKVDKPAESSAKSSENKDSQKKPEKPEKSDEVTVFKCEVITPPMTAHNKCMKTYKQIMADLGQATN